MNHFKLILFFLLLTIVGCINKIDIDTKSFSKQITVNSFLTPDSNVLVNVSYTKNISDGKDYFINDAKVELIWGDSVAELHYLKEGLYTADIKPRMNQQYKIRVEKNDTILTAETFVPDTPNIKNIEVKINTGYSAAEIDYISDLNITLKDSLPGNNYYEIFCPKDFNGYYRDWNEFTEFAQSDDSLLLSEGYIDGSVQNRILISDKDFNNSTATLHLKLIMGSPTSQLFDTLYQEIDFYLVVRSVSEDYYKYMKSYLVYENNIEGQNSSFNSFANMSFISKTVGVYGNVKNGFGIVAGYSEVSRYIYKKEFEIIK